MDMTTATAAILAADTGLRVCVNTYVTITSTDGKETVFSDKVRALGQEALMLVAGLFNKDVDALRTPFAIKVGKGEIFIFSVADKSEITGWFDIKYNLEITSKIASD